MESNQTAMNVETIIIKKEIESIVKHCMLMTKAVGNVFIKIKATLKSATKKPERIFISTDINFDVGIFLWLALFEGFQMKFDKILQPTMTV